MADNTAGIGVAESLINKATPPRDMAITKGLQMAQQNALKKAQLEAAAAAKRQARMDALGKYMTVETGQFKNKSVQEKAAKIGREAILKMYEAGDDYGAITRTKFDAENQIKGLHAEDDILTQLGDDKTFVDAKDARRAIEQGKFNEWYSQQHPLKQRDFIPREDGLVDVSRPKKMDISKIYENQIESGAPEYIDKRAIGMGKVVVSSKIPDDQIGALAYNLVSKNAEYNHYLDWDKSFQDFYDNGGYEKTIGKLDPATQKVITPEMAEAKAKFNFTKDNLNGLNFKEEKVMGIPQTKGPFKPSAVADGGFQWGNKFVTTGETTVGDLKGFMEEKMKDSANGNPLYNQMLKTQMNTPVNKINLTDIGVVSDPKLGDIEPLVIFQVPGYAPFIEYKDKKGRIKFDVMTDKVYTTINGKYSADPIQTNDEIKKTGQFDFSGVVGKSVRMGGSKGGGAKGVAKTESKVTDVSGVFKK